MSTGYLWKKALHDITMVRNTGQELARDALISPQIPNVISRPLSDLIRSAHADKIENVGVAPFFDRKLNQELTGQLNLHRYGNGRYELVLTHPDSGQELGFIQYRLNTPKNPLDRNFVLDEPESYITTQKTYNKSINLLNPWGRRRYTHVGSSLKQGMIEHSIRRLSPDVLPELTSLKKAVNSHARDGFEPNEELSSVRLMKMNEDAFNSLKEKIQNQPVLNSRRLPR